MDKDLNQLRNGIDNLDKELISILAKRALVAEAVGKYKAQHGLQPLDQKRWLTVLNARIDMGKKVGLSSTFIRTIFNTIHRYSLLIQKDNKL